MLCNKEEVQVELSRIKDRAMANFYKSRLHGFAVICMSPRRV